MANVKIDEPWKEWRGVMNGHQFHPDIVRSCPPLDAVPASGYLFRKVDSIPATARDFLSDVERKRGTSDALRCECWGCSVWTDAKAADEALDLFPYWKKRYIVKIKLDGNDGVIKKTPTNRQDEHYTFWRDVRVDISLKQTIYYQPAA